MELNGIEYDLESLINGTVTAAQFQETYKQQIQDRLMHISTKLIKI